jgi:membrane protein CcdC involved in cytochrome C biogenesis
MGKYNPEGVFYLHLTIITFGLIVFTLLKNFNFEDYEATSVLTSTQVNFIYLFFFVGIIGVLLFLVRGYTIKTPKVYTRAGVALVFIVIGLILVAGMLVHDQLLGNDQEIGDLEIVGMLFGSFLTVVGAFIYISVKFPDEQMMKYFKQAVREEIRKRRVEENRIVAWNARQRRLAREKQKKARQVKSKKKSRKTAPTVHEVSMEPADELTIVNCAKCARQLKVSTPERPVTIKCPYCEAIGVIKE